MLTEMMASDPGAFLLLRPAHKTYTLVKTFINTFNKDELAFQLDPLLHWSPLS